MPNEFTIRPATPEDAAEIARINHETWVHTYRGILDDATIEAHSLDEQVKLWQDQLAHPSPSERRFVAETKGMIVGYTGGGRNPDTHSPFHSELFGIYVLHDYQKRGLGSELIRELAAWLLVKGQNSLLVWVMRENPYRRFYEKLGGVLLEQTREVEYSGQKMTVVCYGWSEIEKLV